VIDLIKMYTCFSPLPCIYAMLLKKPKIFQRILWVYVLQTLWRPHTSTWATKGFKGLVVCAKCNRDSYDNELVFRGFFCFSRGRAKARFWGYLLA